MSVLDMESSGGERHNRMQAFVHLHVHSNYSPMAGVSSLEDLCETAQAQGSDTLALTDTNGLYGAMRFVDVATRFGLKPILGAELVHKQHRAVLLVKTTDGYDNLCRLLSARHCDSAFDMLSAVPRHARGLMVLSDDAAALTMWKKRRLQDLYVELTPGALMHHAVALSRRTGLPPVATNRVHFVRREQFYLHRVLRAIALNTTLSQLPHEACCASNHWLASQSDMTLHYPHVPEALRNTRRIAETCHTDWDFQETIFPAFRHYSDAQAFAVLGRKTYEGARQRYGVTLSPEVRDRIRTELTMIRQKRFVQYFLVVEDIVRQSPRTCGRGSAAASIVSYCLGITHVDPIRHHLFFERFLNVGRHDPPDIDIDFPWDERDRILDYIFARYGATCVAMIANHNTLGLRAAIREVGKVYGVSPSELNDVMPRIVRQNGLDYPRIHFSIDRGAAALCRALGLTDPWPEIVRVAASLEGCLQHLSVHCGGIVIVPDDIRRYVPVQISAKGVAVIQWEKDQAEEAGLVKLDILGNRSLAVIRDTIEAIACHTGYRVNESTWDPIHDASTRSLILRAETIGCFYVESPATRLLLRKLWAAMPATRRARLDVFEYLVIVSSLIRPAAHRYVREFVRRAHGEDHQSVHPIVEQTLAETHGILVYQEDVSRIAIALAGFSVEDADQLRKVLSKKHKKHQLEDYKVRFYRDAAERGVSGQAIETVWDMIMSFTGYSFCKPHSASYAQVSFKSAYLRAHYPAEFMAAVINNQGGFYSTFAYLSEARRMGLTVLPLDINLSHWNYTGHGQTLRIGFMQLKSLSREFTERLLLERTTNGPFRSFRDFLDRVVYEPAQVRLLIKAGSFDRLAGEVTRPGLIWRLYATQAQGDRQGMFPGSGTLPFAGLSCRSMPIPADYPHTQKIQHEIDLFGFPVTVHPLEWYASSSDARQCIPSSEMHRYVGKRITMTGWLVTEKPARTQHNEAMEFIMLEDLTGLYDATVFPRIFRLYGHMLSTNRPYLLEGIPEEEFGAVTLTVRKVILLRDTKASITTQRRGALRLQDPGLRQPADEVGMPTSRRCRRDG
ncbi:MAG: DNA polymerase III subunit alpha [Nitrospirales bacterium]